MSNHFRCHSEKQERALETKRKIIVVGTGIQWGKTTIGSVAIRKTLHKYHSPLDNYIITAPNYKIMRQSTLPAFWRVFGDLGKYNAKEELYKIPFGPTFYFRTGTYPDSVVGITNVRFIWGDEAGKYSLYFWENLQARASFLDCPIMLTTSPYTLNWIYKELIRPYQRGRRQDEIELIQASSIENPYFPKEVYHRKKETMDPRRFSMVYGGEWSKFEGLVYNCFDEELNGIEKLDHSQVRYYVGGIDWGYNDPFVIKIRAVMKNGDQVDVAEFYQGSMRSSEVINTILLKHDIYKLRAVFCDPSRPDYISELRSRKVPAFGANNEIRQGIDDHYELIRSRKYKMVKGSCPYSVDEYESYHYAEPPDLKTDQDANRRKADMPVDQQNHCMDADRYITQGLKVMSAEGFMPITPNEEADKNQLTQSQRLAKLMRRSVEHEY